MPNMLQLPPDGTTRDAVIDSSFAQPSPEQQPVTAQGRRIETTAATAAAVLGMMFSKEDNVNLGLRFDEDAAIERKPLQAAPIGGGAGAAAGSNAEIAPGALVPWVPVAPATSTSTPP